MKLAIISDEVSQDFPAVLDLIARHRFHGVEIRSVWNTRPHELSTEQADRIVDQVAAAGLELVAFDSPVFKHPLPRTEADRDAAARLLERSLVVARRLGCPMRIFSFYREGDPKVEAAAEQMAVVLDRVACGETSLLVENGMRTNTSTAHRLATLLELLAPRPLGALWDPGNARFSGLEQTPELEAYALLAPRLRLVHVKDPDGSEYYTRLGAGDVPWSALVERLVADGFAGYLSLETHWRLNRVLSQRERDEPWGDAFSRDGYEPSSTCMGILRDMAAT